MKKYDQYVNDKASNYQKWFSYITMAVPDKVQELIPLVDINMKTRGKTRQTGLYLAVEKIPYQSLGSGKLVRETLIEIIKMLLANGADPNILCNYFDYSGNETKDVSPLWEAALHTYDGTEVVDILLNAGAKVNNGKSAVETLSKRAFLQALGATHQDSNKTMLHYAKEKMNMIKHLVENGAAIPKNIYDNILTSINVFYAYPQKEYFAKEYNNEYRASLEAFIEWLYTKRSDVPSSIKKVIIDKRTKKFGL